MKNLLIVAFAALALQLCSTTTVEHADNKLLELKDATNREVERLQAEYHRLSAEVDQVVESTKHRGVEEIAKKTEHFQNQLRADRSLTYKCRGSREHIFQNIQRQHSNELTRCVEQQASNRMNVLNTQKLALTEYVWDAMFDEEKHIVLCGKETRCLDAAITDVKDKVYELGQVIKDEVQIARHNKDEQLRAIRGCLDRHVANAEHALLNVPTCTF